MKKLLATLAAAIGIAASASAATLDLSTVTAHTTIADGTTLTGTLNSNVKLTIKGAATVTLSDVTINGVNNSSYEWAGLTCSADATIVLQGNNTVRGFYNYYPGIYVPVGDTLTIKGSGTLNASSNGYAAGIGGGFRISCGNIVIESGTITATGGQRSAGIGGGGWAYAGNIAISGGTITTTSHSTTGGAGIGSGECGGVCNILISGGSVVATGASDCAGIGGGFCAQCGNIFISGGTIKANGGSQSPGIGSGDYSAVGESPFCGLIAISGGDVTATAGAGGAAGIGSSSKGSCGRIYIESGITRVIANAADGSATPIGAGSDGTCGVVVVDDSLYDTTSGSTRTITSKVVNLAAVTEDTTVADGKILTGTLGGNYKVSIADGATVTLRDVTINGEDSSNYRWAGITCIGDATIILEGSNTVKGFYGDYPGIYVPQDYTLTIRGDGSLNASGNGYGAGIGGRWGNPCGNIVIDGDCTITAVGGWGAAGIGSCVQGRCGNITLSGGTIYATGGENAAGIGSGYNRASCGDITITKGVTRVTATKGTDAPNSIGAGGGNGTCGTVTIGGVVTGAITESPYTYPDPAKVVDLSALSGDYTANDGEFLRGKTDYAVIVPGGATVVVNGVTVVGGGKNAVTFNANGGTIGNSAYSCVMVEKGMPTMQAGASATKTTRTGYTLVGWFDTSAATGGNMVFDANGYAADGAYWDGAYSPKTSSATWSYAGSVTAYARWTANKYTVTLNANGGTVSGAETVTAQVEYGKYTSQAGANRTVSRTGYTLAGWYDTNAETGGNMVFNAQGYAVNGTYWNGSYSPGKSSATWKYAGNVTVYARWTPAKYTVTLNANGGTVSGAATASFQVEYGKYTSQAGANRAVSLTGYTLVGWYDTSVATGGNMVFDARGYAVNGTYWNGAYSPSVSSAKWKYTGNVTVYARWVASSQYRVVTFDANGGTIGNAAYAAIVVEQGKYTMQAGASATKATRTGYTLVGWYDAKTGGNMVFNAQGYAVNGTYWNGSYVPSKSSATWKYSGNVTAYARWTPVASNIKMAASGDMENDFGLGGFGEDAPPFYQGEFVGTFADGGGRFMLTLDEGLETAYFVTWTDDGGVACECEAAVVGDVLILTTETGEVYHLAWDDGILVATPVE